MKSQSWFKTNLVYGLIAVIPIAILSLLLAEVVTVLERLAEALGLDSAFGAGAAVVVGLLLLLIVCLGAGIAVRTRLGSWSFGKVEDLFLQRIPGYALIGNVLRGFAKDTDAYPPVLLELHGPGSAVLGLVMERHENGVLAVFVPSTPALTVGALHVVEPARVTFLETATVDLASCLSQWGVGSQKVLGGARPRSGA